MQADLPIVFCEEPTGQARQKVMPLLGEYWPSGHYSNKKQ